MEITKDIAALQKLVNTLIDFFVNYSFQVMGAFIVIAVGYVIASYASKLLLDICKRNNLDITLSRFAANMGKFSILAFAAVIALGKFGITIAPFVAALGALAFGTSLAVQGPLSNYGSGLTIILSRPFVVGNTITVQGVTGVVTEVTMAYTFLTNEDGVRISIPNKDIIGHILLNSGPNKIVEGKIGVSYGDDARMAVDTVAKALASVPGVSPEPKPQVGIEAFGDSSVDIGYRYWVPTPKYFRTSYAVNAAIYKAIKEAGLTIPFPQRDVHLIGKS